MSPKIGVPYLQYIPRNMHTVFALLWLSSGLLHWHCGNLTIAPVPAKQPWWIWINTSCEFIMNDCITTTKQSTTKPCTYFLRYTVWIWPLCLVSIKSVCRLPWMITDFFYAFHSLYYFCQLLKKSIATTTKVRGLRWSIQKLIYCICSKIWIDYVMGLKIEKEMGFWLLPWRWYIHSIPLEAG